MKTLKMLGGLALVRSPESIADLVLAGRRNVVDGRRIDSKAQAVGALLNLVREGNEQPSLEESRRGLSALAAKFDEPCPPDVIKRDVMMTGAAGDRPARIYDTVAGDDTPRPTLLYLHGGGWVQGDLDTHDGLCGKLASWAGMRVVSYDYRLAPENKFPAGLDDCVAFYRDVLQQGAKWGIDPSRLVMGGDSAGGNLTAAVLHDLQGAGDPLPIGQLLIYPAVDTRLNSPSMQSLRDAYVLPVNRIHWYLDLYLPEGHDWEDPRVAPLFSDRLADQPPALVVIAGHDPLWDDGLAYADALAKAGVNVDVAEFPGQIHAFVSITQVIPQGNAAIRRCADWLKALIS